MQVNTTINVVIQAGLSVRFDHRRSRHLLTRFGWIRLERWQVRERETGRTRIHWTPPFALGVVVGPVLGAVSAVRRGTWLDTVLTVTATLGITAPSFWVGIVLIYVFGLKLGVLPAYRYTSPLVDFWQSVQQSILPVVVLAVFPVAAAARQTRSSVLEVIQQDYVRTARAKRWPWRRRSGRRSACWRPTLAGGSLPSSCA